jgi:hypothetical protein
MHHPLLVALHEHPSTHLAQRTYLDIDGKYRGEITLHGVVLLTTEYTYSNPDDAHAIIRNMVTWAAELSQICAVVYPVEKQSQHIPENI